MGGVWRAVGWERQGLQNLGWVLGLEPGIEEAVRFTMAKFGSDPKEGMISVREARVPRILALKGGGHGGCHSSLGPPQQISEYY